MSNEDHEAALEEAIKDFVYIHLYDVLEKSAMGKGFPANDDHIIAIEKGLQAIIQNTIWALGDRLESYLNRRLDERLAALKTGNAAEKPAPAAKSEPARPAKAEKTSKKRITKKAVREKLREYISSSDKAIAAANRKHVKQVLVDMGAQHLDDLKPSQYLELLDRLYA